MNAIGNSRDYARLSSKGHLVCPVCGGRLVTAHFKVLYIVAAVLLFPFGMLLFLLPRIARCRTCRHQFHIPGLDVI